MIVLGLGISKLTSDAQTKRTLQLNNRKLLSSKDKKKQNEVEEQPGDEQIRQFQIGDEALERFIEELLVSCIDAKYETFSRKRPLSHHETFKF